MQRKAPAVSGDRVRSISNLFMIVMITCERTIHGLDVQSPTHTQNHTDCPLGVKTVNAVVSCKERTRDRPPTRLLTATIISPAMPISAKGKSAQLELPLVQVCCSAWLAPRLSASCETNVPRVFDCVGVEGPQLDCRTHRNVVRAMVLERRSGGCRCGNERYIGRRLEPADYCSHPL